MDGVFQQLYSKPASASHRATKKYTTPPKLPQAVVPATPAIDHVRCGSCKEAKPKSATSKAQLIKIKKKKKSANCLDCVVGAAADEVAKGIANLESKMPC
jgi:hypothetical protein